MILIIDNYDSFTYNLVQAIGMLGGHEIAVVLNDQISLAEIESRRPSHILISPGPGSPQEAGISVEVVRHFAGKIPILGVCLGHQCIAQAFGARVTRASNVVHGKTSAIHHVGNGIYARLPNPFEAARYHSLAVEPSSLPESFEVTAWTDQHELMGMRCHSLNVEGVQFHPESFLTPAGSLLLKGFIHLPTCKAKLR